MPPNQPGSPAPGNHDPYGFFMNPEKKSGGKFGALNANLQGKSKKQRIILAAIVGGIVMVLLIIIAMVASSGGNGVKTSMLSIAQTQQEIARVSANGNTKSKDLSVKGYATTVEVSMQSGEQQTLAYLKTQKVKPSTKALSAKQDASTDATLKAADQAGTYDNTLVATLEKMVKDYQALLKTTYDSASGSNQKKVLQNLYTQAFDLSKNQPPVN